jgi:hypothetical protein
MVATLNINRFTNRLPSPKFTVFMHQLLTDIMSELSVKTVRALPKGKFREFEDVIIQDGTTITLNRNLQNIYPYRFTAQSP